MNDKIKYLTDLLSKKTIVEQLNILAKEYAGKITFSTSFQLEDQVLTDIICQNEIPIEIFTLDTGRHFEETYKTLNKTIEHYKKQIKTYFPNYEQVEKLLTEKGPFSFYASVENRIECCHIRKVEPLQRALNEKICWITGLRIEQSDARKELSLLEWDENFQLVKFNPLLDWTYEQVKEHIRLNNVPYNVLQDRNYPSVGCAPCTRPIQPGEPLRAGRWWWEENSKKECGLHVK